MPATTAPYDVTRFIGDSTGPSYAVAQFIMQIVDCILGIFGLERHPLVVTVLYAAIVFAIALAIGRIVQWLVLNIMREAARRRNSDVYDALSGVNFFRKACRIIPPAVFLILIQITLSGHDSLALWLPKLSVIYIIFTLARTFSALAVAIWKLLDTRKNKRKLPLSGIVQLAKTVIWILAAIFTAAIIADKSPAALLAGLGAFAAVLMLVFKDSILGVVAGVQLAQNDSLHVGDWITVGGTDADGIVTEVSLTAVKVLNWNKTTTTLPPYSLISAGFTSYRTMQLSNTRRICRAYMIDADSVQPATPEMLDSIRSVPFMDRYISLKLAQKAEGKTADINNPDGLPNGTIDTNLGLFRAYFKMWLDNNPHISHDSDCFVSTLPQTPSGIPFQVYCFTATSEWMAFEAIQDTVFEQIAAMLPLFGLYTFENPSGRDTVIDGYLSPGHDINDVLGAPYPFMNDKKTTQAHAQSSHPDGG